VQLQVMSALGQKQTFTVQKGMSALPPIATSIAFSQHVRFGPIADISRSFDYFVGAADQGVGDRDAERLGCSEIYDELYLSCLLYQQIGRLVAFENATGVDAGQAVRSY